MNIIKIVLVIFFFFASISVQICSGVPIIIGHRGACGYRPENTLASYEKALEFGTDYIEIDLASTKDHVLVASHNPDITFTTDVSDHPEFLNRYTKKNVSGVEYEGYFVDDFTVNELKSLRTRERYSSFRGNQWDNLYSMPTFDEYLHFIKAKEIELNRKIGIYVETKHPYYYRSIGLPLEEKLIQTLNDYGYSSRDDLVFIQSFESNLKNISKMTQLPLIQLISGTEGDTVQYDTQTKWSKIASKEGLKEVATYAQGVGAHKSVIFKIQETSTNNVIEREIVQTEFIKNAHDNHLQIHVWTFRKERENFEKKDKLLYGTVEEEIVAFFKAGVDGIFTDQPDIGMKLKNEHYIGSYFLSVPYSQVLLPMAICIVIFVFDRFIFKLTKKQMVMDKFESKIHSDHDDHHHADKFDLAKLKSKSETELKTKMKLAHQNSNESLVMTKVNLSNSN